MSEFHLKQPGFTYSACGLFTKHRQRIHKVRETGYLKHLCRNESDKIYFAHDAAYSDSKNSAKKVFSDTIYRDRAYEIAINCKYDGYRRSLVRMV